MKKTKVLAVICAISMFVGGVSRIQRNKSAKGHGNLMRVYNAIWMMETFG